MIEYNKRCNIPQILEVKFVTFTLFLKVPNKLMIVYLRSQQTHDQLPVFIKKVLLELYEQPATSIHVGNLYACFCTTRADLSSGDRLCGQQSKKKDLTYDL